MNRLIKSEWIERIKRNPDLPPYFLLNKMYEEAVGEKIKTLNKYRYRLGGATSPKELSITKHDLIHPKVMGWAEISSANPIVTSYHENGGIGLRKPNITVEDVWIHGTFMKDGILVRSRDTIENFAEIIRQDL